MKVMIVEDSRAVRERMLMMLEGIIGRQALIEADSVAEAAWQMLAHKPEIVILDLLLPDGHGLDLLITLKALQQSTRIMVMTSDPSEQYRKRAMQLGACHFFDKAKDFDKVLAIIAELVRLSNQAPENREKQMQRYEQSATHNYFFPGDKS